MENKGVRRYYEKMYAGHYENLDPLLSKAQLLSLAALIIDLRQHDWLEEIKEKLGELEA